MDTQVIKDTQDFLIDLMDNWSAFDPEYYRAKELYQRLRDALGDLEKTA